MSWVPIDYLKQYVNQLKVQDIFDRRTASGLWPPKGSSPVGTQDQKVFLSHEWPKTQFKKFDCPQIILGKPDELSAEQHQELHQLLKQGIPWKKGPFEIFGVHIDAEWRSDMKWDRIVRKVTPLQRRRVADVGAHNGYFMFRMLSHDPELVIGFEPVRGPFETFWFLQRLLDDNRTFMEPFGIQDLDLFPRFFDTVFCMGVIYHQTDPLLALKKIHNSLKAGGELVLESQGISGDEAYCLIPRSRYAGARAVWCVPTAKALENWLHRAGFRDIEMISSIPLTVDEQRATEWAPIGSLVDALDPHHRNLTIEGYPAPWRHCFRAIK